MKTETLALALFAITVGLGLHPAMIALHWAWVAILRPKLEHWRYRRHMKSQHRAFMRYNHKSIEYVPKDR
jgi:hypothetical protein